MLLACIFFSVTSFNKNKTAAEKCRKSPKKCVNHAVMWDKKTPKWEKVEKSYQQVGNCATECSIFGD